MKKILVGFAVVAISTVSTSAVFAKKSAKPAAAPAATVTPAMLPTPPSKADMAMYKKNLHDSGMKK